MGLAKRKKKTQHILRFVVHGGARKTKISNRKLAVNIIFFLYSKPPSASPGNQMKIIKPLPEAALGVEGGGGLQGEQDPHKDLLFTNISPSSISHNYPLLHICFFFNIL